MFTETTDRPAGRLARAASFLSHPLPIDAFVQLVDPLWSSTSLRGRVVSVVAESARAVTLVIKPGRGWDGHQPGQWIALGVEIDGVRHTRCYSLTSVPRRADGCISVTVQAIPDGLVSNHIVRSLRPGTMVHLAQAAGDFTLPATRSRDLLFVTGGSGLTPVMGMLRTLHRAGTVGDVVVLHHAPSRAEALFATELDRLTEECPGLRVHFTATGAGA
ncbi:MAG TPA: ferredoxin reductase, partial [Acidimicrobiales bacterium]